MNKTLLKTGLGLAVALILCLLPMPYGYYILVRFIAMIIFICMAISFYGRNHQTLAVIAGSLAVLFQPLVKITLGRELWNFVDIVVAIALFVLWWQEGRHR